MKSTQTLILLSFVILVSISGCVSQEEVRVIDERELFDDIFDKMEERLGTSAYVRSYPPWTDVPSIPEYISAVGEARFNLTGEKSGNEFILYVVVSICKQGTEDYCFDEYKDYLIQENKKYYPNTTSREINVKEVSIFETTRFWKYACTGPQTENCIPAYNYDWKYKNMILSIGNTFSPATSEDLLSVLTALDLFD